MPCCDFSTKNLSDFKVCACPRSSLPSSDIIVCGSRARGCHLYPKLAGSCRIAQPQGSRSAPSPRTRSPRRRPTSAAGPSRHSVASGRCGRAFTCPRRAGPATTAASPTWWGRRLLDSGPRWADPLRTRFRSSVCGGHRSPSSPGLFWPGFEAAAL
jgi:hypothetical protein